MSDYLIYTLMKRCCTLDGVATGSDYLNGNVDLQE